MFNCLQFFPKTTNFLEQIIINIKYYNVGAVNKDMTCLKLGTLSY